MQERAQKMKRKSNLKFSLYTLFAISIIVPIFLASLLITTYMNSENMKSTKNQVENITKQLSFSMNTYYQDFENIANTPALYSDILNLLHALNRGYFFTDIVEQNKLQSNYISTFTKLLHTNASNIDSITFYPANPDNAFYFEINKRYGGLKTINSQNYQENDYYKIALDSSKTMIFTDIYNKEINGSNIPMYSALKGIKDFDSKKMIGVLKIDVHFDNIETLIKDIQISENSLILLSNKNGILFSNKEYDLDLLEKIKTRPKNFLINNQKFTAIYEEIGGFDWNIVFILSHKDLAAGNLTIYFLSFAISFLTILIAFYIFKKFSIKIVNSVNSIVFALEKIQGGDLNTRVTIDMDNELKSIAIAINKMTVDLDKHIKQEFLAVVEQKNAENRALQSQINPHFMYNTLNCLLALNRMGETKKLEKAILNLTHLLRYTSVSEKSVNLKTECDFLEKYINLQQIRFEDRLFYSFSIDEYCENIVIPKLILQPLIENSIIHGMEPTDKPILIELLATYCAKTKICTITLKDNGLGFIQNSNEEHIGLSNVKQRLTLWNEDVTFLIESNKNVGTTIIITF